MQIAEPPLLIVAKWFAFLATVVLAALWVWSCEPRWHFAALAVASGFAFVGLTLLCSRLTRLANEASDKALVTRAMQPSAALGHSLTFKEPVPRADLPEAYRIFQDTFGADIMGLPQLQQILERNPNTVWRVGVERRTADGGRTRAHVGYFEVFPLSERGVRALTTRRRDGRTFSAADICERNSESSLYYLAAVATDSASAHPVFDRAAVVNELWSYIADLNLERTITLYTRPVTEDGMRLASSHGFAPLEGARGSQAGQAIWVRSIEAGALIRRPD